MTGEVSVVWGGNAATVVIDRPETRNAISASVMAALEDVLDTLEREPPTAVVVRGGGDRAFVSGGDLRELAELRSHEGAREMAARMRLILDRLAALPSLVVAMLNGDAYGGGAELAVASDIRICADDVRIGFTQVRLGITPAWGGIERLTELVGRSRALFMLGTGAVVDASHALAWGLVEEVVPRTELEQRCSNLVEMLARAPAPALQGMKEVVSSVRPPVHPAERATALEVFARSWVADDHWRMADAHDRERRLQRR